MEQIGDAIAGPFSNLGGIVVNILGFPLGHMAVFGEKLVYVRHYRIYLLIDNDTYWRNAKRGVISGESKRRGVRRQIYRDI
ncbi:hypothetical protein KSB_51690 [Ktedonobacter robiniae]|uniref:Uncharacterized protein n=1 Tax=Ktedonobacter robiniae TaxID=2778365 RepID=A0ABQ3UVI3_9CHLR|nr:hypothetical protein KSB_51690 [Ktedonobacter robiniae]